MPVTSISRPRSAPRPTITPATIRTIATSTHSSASGTGCHGARGRSSERGRAAGGATGAGTGRGGGVDGRLLPPRLRCLLIVPGPRLGSRPPAWWTAGRDLDVPPARQPTEQAEPRDHLVGGAAREADVGVDDPAAAVGGRVGEHALE